jgi:hypothetical protein
MGSLRSLKRQDRRYYLDFSEVLMNWKEEGKIFRLSYGEFGRKIFLEVFTFLNGKKVYMDLGCYNCWINGAKDGKESLKRLQKDLQSSNDPWYVVLKFPSKWVSRKDAKSWFSKNYLVKQSVGVSG